MVAGLHNGHESPWQVAACRRKFRDTYRPDLAGRHGVLAAVAVFIVLLAGLGPAIEAGQLPLLVERNLFSPERKPQETQPEQQDARAPKAPTGSIQLDGVIFFGDMKKAILRVNPNFLKDPSRKGGPFVTVRENEQVGDYRVARIEPRSIILEKEKTTFVIPLFAPGKATPPASNAAGTPTTTTQPTATGSSPQPQPARQVRPRQAPLPGSDHMQPYDEPDQALEQPPDIPVEPPVTSFEPDAG